MRTSAARLTVGSALAVGAFCDATAAPGMTILYHEAIRPQVLVAENTRNMVFDAYGRRFNLELQPNEAVLPAVPAGRADIEPLRGRIEGLPRSWVRLTHTRSGWRGMLSDGQESYAIEPASEVAGSVVQPLSDTSPTASVMYRLKDALLPTGAALCQILNADGTPYSGAVDVGSNTHDPQGRVTAKMLIDAITKDAANVPDGPDLKLVVGVVADYEFYQIQMSDPEGAIIARWDIVDGIWSNQVGVKISLAPLTVLTNPSEPFTKTAASDLLAQVRQYRGANSAQLATGVTHLMTGRDLDGNIVGISYMSSVCNGDVADSLSEGALSTLESALIAAHELGHNFNAPHDGEAGACLSTPQTYLMAPQLNYSDQFSSCSLDQINLRIQTASCLTPYVKPDVALELTSDSASAVTNSAFTLSFLVDAIGDDTSNGVTVSAALPSNLTVQSATAVGGMCTIAASTIACTLGDMASLDSRQITLTLVGNTIGTTAASFSVASSNDSNSADNSGRVSIDIAAAPTVPTSTTASVDTPKSGGGGGSFDLGILGILAGAAGLTVRRRTMR